MSAAWLSEHCEETPRTPRDYSMVSTRLRRDAARSPFDSEREALREEADRWKAAARRKSWSDERSVAR